MGLIRTAGRDCTAGLAQMVYEEVVAPMTGAAPGSAMPLLPVGPPAPQMWATASPFTESTVLRRLLSDQVRCGWLGGFWGFAHEGLPGSTPLRYSKPDRLLRVPSDGQWSGGILVSVDGAGHDRFGPGVWCIWTDGWVNSLSESYPPTHQPKQTAATTAWPRPSSLRRSCRPSTSSSEACLATSCGAREFRKSLNRLCGL